MKKGKAMTEKIKKEEIEGRSNSKKQSTEDGTKKNINFALLGKGALQSEREERGVDAKKIGDGRGRIRSGAGKVMEKTVL